MSEENATNAAPVHAVVPQPICEVLDTIYAFCDVLMHAQNMAVLDAVCRSWPIDDGIESNLDQVLGVLTATLPVRSRLPSRDVLLKRARLLRNGKPTWMFEASQRYGQLVHVTRNGTVYAILAGHNYGKPFWVGRLCDGAWCTVERELRARSIEFEDAGEYVFPSA